PQIALGKVVLGVAHTLASEFNDFLAHTIYLSSDDDMTIPDGMMATINLGEASPYVAFFVALLATQDSAVRCHDVGTYAIGTTTPNPGAQNAPCALGTLIGRMQNVTPS
ncbi:hypothetical protein BKA70DRAFT_1063925, partial [Coprinopsis sp. MPI-PUGE-AT-0042]